MSETIDVPLPHDIQIQQMGYSLRGTREQIEKVKAACEAALAPKPRRWRQGALAYRRNIGSESKGE